MEDGQRPAAAAVISSCLSAPPHSVSHLRHSSRPLGGESISQTKARMKERRGGIDFPAGVPPRPTHSPSRAMSHIRMGSRSQPLWRSQSQSHLGTSYLGESGPLTYVRSSGSWAPGRLERARKRLMESLEEGRASARSREQASSGRAHGHAVSLRHTFRLR